MNFLKSIVSTCQRDLLNYSNNFLVQSTQYQIQCAFLTVLTNIGQFRNSVTLESESNRFFQRIRSWSLKSEKRVSNSPIKKLRYFMYSIKQISKKQLLTRTHELNRVLNNFTLHLLLFSARLYTNCVSYLVASSSMCWDDRVIQLLFSKMSLNAMHHVALPSSKCDMPNATFLIYQCIPSRDVITEIHILLTFQLRLFGQCIV